jgi:hypothetical protein
VEQLLTMNSGARPPDQEGGSLSGEWNEVTRGISSITEILNRYGKDQKNAGNFVYNNSDTNALMLAIEGRTNFGDLFEKNIWIKSMPESEATWLLDKNKKIYAAAGFGATLRDSGAQTLTVFTLQTPHSLLRGNDNDAMRQKLEDAVIDSINSVLAEDIRDLLMVDAHGKPCIETKTTLDLEHALGLPGGNIFHAPLSWPFVADDSSFSTPAQRWGVDTPEPRIFFCGSTARRGGAVSGIAGHNAAMAVLEFD